MNNSKLKFMVFKPRQKRQNVDIKLKISNCTIGRVRDTMSLGVILDEVVKFMYSYKNRPASYNIFKEMFLVTNQVHSYNTRNSITCYLFPAWINMTFRIRFHGPNLFISLNNNIHGASTISLFKSRLKKFLLS